MAGRHLLLADATVDSPGTLCRGESSSEARSLPDKRVGAWSLAAFEVHMAVCPWGGYSWTNTGLKFRVTRKAVREDSRCRVHLQVRPSARCPWLCFQPSEQPRQHLQVPWGHMILLWDMASLLAPQRPQAASPRACPTPAQGYNIPFLSLP